MSGFLAVGYFLVSLFFSLLLIILWARVFLRYFRISALHPVSQMINRFSDPIIRPLEGRIPVKNKLSNPYDWLSLALIVVVEVIKFSLLALILFGRLLPLGYLVILTLADLIIQPANFLFYLILIRVIMSWVNPSWQNPVADVIKQITDPLLNLGRRIVPDISGFDFSPFIIMIILKIITLFISASLPLGLG